MRRPQQPPSLKARAVHWLSQREHSEAELRRKLMRAEREAVRRAALVADRVDGDRDATPGGAVGMHAADGADRMEPSGGALDDGADHAADRSSLAERIDSVVVWLREHDFLSDARFVESRVHARAPGHGLRRIRQELEQHGVALPAETAAALRGSEFERAEAMCRRRYGDDGPATAIEQARCARWLVQRGFSGDTVARVVRAMRPPASPSGRYAHGERSADAEDG